MICISEMSYCRDAVSMRHIAESCVFLSEMFFLSISRRCADGISFVFCLNTVPSYVLSDTFFNCFNCGCAIDCRSELHKFRDASFQQSFTRDSDVSNLSSISLVLKKCFRSIDYFFYPQSSLLCFVARCHHRMMS